MATICRRGGKNNNDKFLPEVGIEAAGGRARSPYESIIYDQFGKPLSAYSSAVTPDEHVSTITKDKDLGVVVQNWRSLPTEIRQGILTIVRLFQKHCLEKDSD